MTEPECRTLTVIETAEILGISTETLYRSVEKGECPIPVLRFGTRIVFPKDGLDLILRATVPQENP